ncbi:LssY C-terminal domain-containing protein [Paraburkholderia terrae]|uniref:LssY C-terminal domain-containing protein n=1 Tax=Paraburkholderia terrae TaxID=311230 RepID=UPI00296B4DED|nr:LssY C-terminal domain-containing protein [Paraburkholderia terrae]MDW3663332.1 LssY C-terminal domain-containing protein [Paraburkholderia terrae]
MSVVRPLRRALKRVVFTASVVLAIAGCSTWQAPPHVDDGPLRTRAVSATNRNVRVSAAVLGSEDSVRMFGVDIEKTHVQSVWVEVQNGTSQALWLLRSGTDPDYFSPHEVAWPFHTLLGGATNTQIDDYFSNLGFKNPIPPGETRSGILFTNPDRRTKLVNIDLFGSQTLIPFTLFAPVPGGTSVPQYDQLSFAYPETAITDCPDLASLRAALERLPCCATNADGTVNADPLNAVLVGKLTDIGAALVRRNYRRDLRGSDTVQRVFGREADAVARKQAQGGAPATWIRAWLAPIRFQGQPVYVAQVGRPVGGRFVPRGDAHLILHGNVDEARNFLIQDLMYSGGLDKLGFAYGVREATKTQPRTTLDNATYYTDGLRAVMFFATRPLSFSDVQLIDWVPYLEQREAIQRKETGDASK